MSQNESTESYHKRLQELERTVQELESKIARLDREKAVFSAKSRLYADELNRSHRREMAQESLVAELVERQHELNVMLNRSNVMLARAHEATAMLSVEFGELARALPEPLALDAEAPEMEQIEDRLQRINSLFKKTGSLSAEIAETLHRNAAATDAASADAARTTPAPPPEPKEAAAPQARASETPAPASSTAADAEPESPARPMPPPEPDVVATARDNLKPEPAATASPKSEPRAEAAAPAFEQIQPEIPLREEPDPEKPDAAAAEDNSQSAQAPASQLRGEPSPVAESSRDDGQRDAGVEEHVAKTAKRVVPEPVPLEQVGAATAETSEAGDLAEGARRTTELFNRPRATPAPSLDDLRADEDISQDILDSVIEEMEQSENLSPEQSASLIGRIRDMLFR